MNFFPTAHRNVPLYAFSGMEKSRSAREISLPPPFKAFEAATTFPPFLFFAFSVVDLEALDRDALPIAQLQLDTQAGEPQHSSSLAVSVIY